MKLALPKGRILDDVLPLLKRAGLASKQDPNQSRKLVLDTDREDFKLVIIRASDVPTYVQFGAADLGIVGKDLLMEQDGANVYELLDLKLARCRLSVAEPADLAQCDDPKRWTHVRIATKYPNIARAHFAGKGVQTEIIKLYGSMELAPMVGLSDRVVDLVSSGQTLKENGLVEMETIANVSARLVANKASMKLKQPQLNDLVEKISHCVNHSTE